MSVALVTGAARRIGREIALALADDGYDLALTIRAHGADQDGEKLCISKTFRPKLSQLSPRVSPSLTRCNIHLPPPIFSPVYGKP